MPGIGDEDRNGFVLVDWEEVDMLQGLCACIRSQDHRRQIGNMIRIDEIWLSTQPLDMRAGMDTVMAQVLRAFGYIKPHCAYLFCNKRGHRMKVLVHDGLGIWLCARRLEQGKFHWAQVHQGESMAISPEQLQALIQGLPWQRIGRQQVVTML